jgi:hypothetical protein
MDLDDIFDVFGDDDEVAAAEIDWPLITTEHR